MAPGARRWLHGVAASFAIALALLVSAGSAAASTTHDLTGTWSCCGSGGAANQTWTITTMDKASGSFSGTGQGGSIKMLITGTATGDSVTLLTDYEGSSYEATFKGTLSADSKTMSGSWESGSSQKGTWTATRPSAPTPGSGDSPDPNVPGGTKAKTIPGDIYVVDSSANLSMGAVYKVNPANGQSSLVHVGPPFVGIRGVALGPEGNLFVTDVGAHAIQKIDMKTSAVTTITTPNNPLMRAPWGIVYEPLLGEFLVADSFLERVVRVNPKTGAVKQVALQGGLAEPHGIALELGGSAYVADFRSRAVIEVARTAGGWHPSTFKKGPFSALEGIAIDATAGGSRFYVSDAIAPGGTSGETAVKGVGGLFSWLGGAAPELLYQPTTAGGVLLTPLGLAPSSDGKTLYIGSTGGLPGTGSIVEMNLASKKLKTLAGGFSSPISIAVAPPKGVAVSVSTSGSGASVTPNGATVTVTSPKQPLAATVSVSVNVPGGFRPGASASKVTKVKAVTKPIPAGKRTKVRVNFKAALRKQIKAAVQAGKKVKAKIAITATSSSGSTRKSVKRVSIKP